MRRLGTVAIVVLTLVLVSSSLTFAQQTHSYGEMVDYPLTFPVDGAVSIRDTFSAVRSDGDHHAQDLMAPKMTPVVAAASGTVTWVNWSRDAADLNPERCCTVVVTHDDGWESWYIHLNNDTPGTDDGQAWGIADGITPGVRVEAGQLLGWVGDSGNAENTAPHLHFELRDPAGVIVNPYEALLAVCGDRCAVTGGAVTAPPVEAGPDDVLVLGSRGDVVREVQQGLADAGFSPGPIDGIFGSRTMSAVMAFQTARGLLVDGKVGPQTKGALAASDSGTTVSTTPPASGGAGAVVAFGTSGGSVFDLQATLAALGHAPGPVDGIFGPTTRAAVERFQAASGVGSGGTVDQATWDALLAAGDGGASVVLAYGTRGSKVLEVQTRLDDLGHAPGPLDGIFGPTTRAAVERFQAASGVGSGGTVDQATWDALVG